MKLSDLKVIGDIGHKEDVCEHCGNSYGDYTINPYDEDIHGEENWEYICSECYDQCCQDI